MEIIQSKSLNSELQQLREKPKSAELELKNYKQKLDRKENKIIPLSDNFIFNNLPGYIYWKNKK